MERKKVARRASSCGVEVVEGEVWGGGEFEFEVREGTSTYVHTKLTGAVDFSCPDQSMACLEFVVVLEVKASVRAWAAKCSGSEVSPGVVKVFRREDVDPQRGDGRVMYEDWSVFLRTGGIKAV